MNEEHRDRAWWLAPGIASVAVSLLSTCAAPPEPGIVEPPPSDPVASSDLPPLVVEEDAPQLLDGPSADERFEEEEASEAHVANRACYVCHANYEEELLATLHTAQGIGCLTCHGESFAHRNDENNTTPPDIMWSLEAIGPTCQTCHETHDAPAALVVDTWLERRGSRADPELVVCTDCHGEHRMRVRTIRWDRDTGELLDRE